MTADRDLIERVDRGMQMALRQMQIDRGVFQVRVSHQKLDRPQVSSGQAVEMTVRGKPGKPTPGFPLSLSETPFRLRRWPLNTKASFDSAAGSAVIFEQPMNRGTGMAVA